MHIQPHLVFKEVKVFQPTGLLVRSNGGLIIPKNDTYFEYGYNKDGLLIESVETELPFMIPIRNVRQCWHWDNITLFSDFDAKKLEKRLMRLAIITDDHMFIYVTKVEDMVSLIEGVIEANVNVGRILKVQQGGDNTHYTVLTTDKIKTKG